jgi:hypothetical protein
MLVRAQRDQAGGDDDRALGVLRPFPIRSVASEFAGATGARAEARTAVQRTRRVGFLVRYFIDKARNGFKYDENLPLEREAYDVQRDVEKILKIA